MARVGKEAGADVLDAEAVLARYEEALEAQPLAHRTRDAYRAQVRSYLRWLASTGRGPTVLFDPRMRDSAVREYKRHVKSARRWAPTSVNQALAAIDNLYHSLNQGAPDVAREDLPQAAPRALDEAEQRAFIRSIERCPSARDRAIATVFLCTAVRLSELAALDLADVSMSARRGRVKVRLGKGDAYREVPLNSAARTALAEWLAARDDQVARRAYDPGALWLSRSGGRLSARAIDSVVRALAADAGLDISAHLLRHTCLTNLVRGGADVVLVAELAGHRRLDTTRRYSLPSEADRDAAVEALLGQ